MSIKICDSIMGSGKSSAAINYMNANPEKKFIYITPFLDEAARIQKACPDLYFKEPSNKIPDFRFRKYEHAKYLIQAGENITSTHSLFSMFTGDIVKYIKHHHYTLIIDEDMEFISACDTILADDLNDQIALGRARRENGKVYFQNYESFHGSMREIMDKAEEHELIDVFGGTDSATVELFYWLYPKHILEAFENVYVLTYMFNAQGIKWYFDIEGIHYEFIHTDYDGETYSFTEESGYTPEYIKNVRDKIHIVGTKRMNRVGDKKHDLSVSWYQRQGESGSGVRQIGKNLANFFNNIVPDIPTSDRMWTTFDSAKSIVRGKGFMRSDTSFNIRATNELRNKRALAYCVNVFINPFEKNYLVSRGVKVDEDAYALSSMVQWIWRSAIREGDDIWLYIPSSRMRNLLLGWMDSLAKGGDAG